MNKFTQCLYSNLHGFVKAVHEKAAKQSIDEYAMNHLQGFLKFTLFSKGEFLDSGAAYLDTFERAVDTLLLSPKILINLAKADWNSMWLDSSWNPKTWKRLNSASPFEILKEDYSLPRCGPPNFKQWVKSLQLHHEPYCVLLKFSLKSCGGLMAFKDMESFDMKKNPRQLQLLQYAVSPRYLLDMFLKTCLTCF